MCTYIYIYIYICIYIYRDRERERYVYIYIYIYIYILYIHNIYIYIILLPSVYKSIPGVDRSAGHSVRTNNSGEKETPPDSNAPSYREERFYTPPPPGSDV